MNNTLAVYAPTGSNTVQGIWKPISNSNTIGKAGLLVKVVAGSTAVSATDVLTFVAIPTDGDTVTIGGQVYRFKNTIAAINDVFIGANLAAAIVNLVDAINLAGTSGTNWFAGTQLNQYVSSTAHTGTTLTVTALQPGTPGNSVAVSATDPTNATWATATLAGGVDPTSASPTNQASIDLLSAFTDFPTDILVDDGSNPVDTTNIGKFVACAPIDSYDQFRLPVVLGGGAPGAILVPAPTPNYGSVAPVSAIPASSGVAARRFQALENFQPGQMVLCRRYYGTQTF